MHPFAFQHKVDGANDDHGQVKADEQDPAICERRLFDSSYFGDIALVPDRHEVHPCLWLFGGRWAKVTKFFRKY